MIETHTCCIKVNNRHAKWMFIWLILHDSILELNWPVCQKVISLYDNDYDGANNDTEKKIRIRCGGSAAVHKQRLCIGCRQEFHSFILNKKIKL